MSRTGARAFVRGLAAAAVTAIAFSGGVRVPAASAEIYVCKGPDGKTTFVGSASQCPGARPHDLKKEIHVEDPPTSAPKSTSPAARAPRPPRAAAASGTSGQEQMWRRKQAEARQKLADVEERWQRGRDMVNACNRGSEWWGTDESGIRRNIPCSELRREFAGLEQQRAELTAYVDGGLAEECRRAGCLPGWLR